MSQALTRRHPPGADSSTRAEGDRPIGELGSGAAAGREAAGGRRWPTPSGGLPPVLGDHAAPTDPSSRSILGVRPRGGVGTTRSATGRIFGWLKLAPSGMPISGSVRSRQTWPVEAWSESRLDAASSTRSRLGRRIREVPYGGRRLRWSSAGGSASPRHGDPSRDPRDLAPPRACGGASPGCLSIERFGLPAARNFSLASASEIAVDHDDVVARFPFTGSPLVLRRELAGSSPEHLRSCAGAPRIAHHRLGLLVGSVTCHQGTVALSIGRGPAPWCRRSGAS